MSSVSGQPGEARFSWVHFVASSGADGRLWAEQYRDDEIQAMVRGMDQSLVLLRKGQLEAGRVLLDDVRTRRERMPQLSTVRHVLERRYHGLLAYYLYCLEDYEAAEHELGAAHDAVVQAISCARFLLPLANHCTEFRLHRARIARNQRRWAEMLQHIDVVQAMADDRSPLCRLDDGTDVYYATLAHFYDALPRLSDDERRDLVEVYDREERHHSFLRQVQALYVLPGFVVPLP